LYWFNLISPVGQNIGGGKSLPFQCRTTARIQNIDDGAGISTAYLEGVNALAGSNRRTTLGQSRANKSCELTQQILRSCQLQHHCAGASPGSINTDRAVTVNDASPEMRVILQDAYSRRVGLPRYHAKLRKVARQFGAFDRKPCDSVSVSITAFRDFNYMFGTQKGPEVCDVGAISSAEAEGDSMSRVDAAVCHQESNPISRLVGHLGKRFGVVGNSSMKSGQFVMWNEAQGRSSIADEHFPSTQRLQDGVMTSSKFLGDRTRRASSCVRFLHPISLLVAELLRRSVSNGNAASTKHAGYRACGYSYFLGNGTRGLSSIIGLHGREFLIVGKYPLPADSNGDALTAQERRNGWQRHAEFPRKGRRRFSAFVGSYDRILLAISQFSHGSKYTVTGAGV
jgi:hypothetical protein